MSDDDVSPETKKRRQAWVSINKAMEALDAGDYEGLQSAASNLSVRAVELEELGEGDG